MNLEMQSHIPEDLKKTPISSTDQLLKYVKHFNEKDLIPVLMELQEIFPLIRELHAELCGEQTPLEEPEISEPETKSKRLRRSKDKLRETVMEVLKSGEVYHVSEMFKITSKAHPEFNENDVTSCLAYMVNGGLVKRVQLGRYQAKLEKEVK